MLSFLFSFSSRVVMSRWMDNPPLHECLLLFFLIHCKKIEEARRDDVYERYCVVSVCGWGETEWGNIILEYFLKWTELSYHIVSWQQKINEPLKWILRENVLNILQNRVLLLKHTNKYICPTFIHSYALGT